MRAKGTAWIAVTGLAGTLWAGAGCLNLPRGGACADVDCSGRGRCHVEAGGIRTQCQCDQGYRAVGLQCLPADVASRPDGGGETGESSCNNGRVERGEQCDGAGRSCTTSCGSKGIRHCVECRWGDCEAPAEKCDGQDNDCDGEVDEGCPCALDWQLIHPSPQGNHLRQVWMAPEGHAVAVGDVGTVLLREGDAPRGGGGAWRVMPLDFYGSLRAVWGDGQGQFWVAGDGGAIFRFDGARWIREPTPTVVTLRGLWGDGDLLWAVGDEGTVLVYDSGAWGVEAIVGARSLRAIAGNGPDRVVAVGQLGALFVRRDGGWEELESPTTETLLDLWVSPDGLFFAVGEQGVIVRGEGEQWTSRPVVPGMTLRGVWGIDSNDVYAAGRFDWAGNRDSLLHFDGERWNFMSSQSGRSLWDIAGTSAHDLVAVGLDGTLLHFDGRDWTEQTRRAGGSTNFHALWGYGNEILFAAGQGGVVLRYDGLDVTRLHTGQAKTLFGLWGSSPDDLFAVGAQGTLLRFDGHQWSSFPALPCWADLWGVWGRDPADVYAVGEGGTVLHYDGVEWRIMPSGTREHLHALWGSPDGALFAVGGNGTVLRWNGDRWLSTQVAAGEALMKVWGSAGDDVYALGAQGSLWHFDGQAWQPEPAAAGLSLCSLWAAGPDNLYALSREALVHLFRRGKLSSSSPLRSQWDVTAIWGSAPNNLYVAGLNGTLWHRCGAGNGEAHPRQQ